MEEIVAVMRAVGDSPDGLRLRGVIVVLWRAGLRISGALALAESDLDRGRGAVLVRRGKGGRRRELGMDRWGWEQLDPWLAFRSTLPVGALFCVLRGATRGRRARPPGFACKCRRRPARLGFAAGSRRIIKPTCSLCRRVHDVPAQKQSDLRICRIFRSLQDEHERVPDAIGALASQAEQVGAVDRQRLLGHVGAQPYVGCRDLLAAQAENVHRDVVRRVQQIVLEERTEKDDQRGPRHADQNAMCTCIPRTSWSKSA